MVARSTDPSKVRPRCRRHFERGVFDEGESMRWSRRDPGPIVRKSSSSRSALSISPMRCGPPSHGIRRAPPESASSTSADASMTWPAPVISIHMFDAGRTPWRRSEPTSVVATMTGTTGALRPGCLGSSAARRRDDGGRLGGIRGTDDANSEVRKDGHQGDPRGRQLLS